MHNKNMNEWMNQWQTLSEVGIELLGQLNIDKGILQNIDIAFAQAWCLVLNSRYILVFAPEASTLDPLSLSLIVGALGPVQQDPADPVLPVVQSGLLSRWYRYSEKYRFRYR